MTRHVEKNQTGVTGFKDDIIHYLETEMRYGATLGPFQKSPFGEENALSPLNSVAKKDSQDGRVIVNLSFPKGDSINDGILKDYYLGEYDKLTFLSVDDLVRQVRKLGPGCKLFKRDLCKGF